MFDIIIIYIFIYIMSKKVWGPITWITFHSLCELIKEEYFEEEKQNIINLIKSMCVNLPCPYCSQHASIHLKKMNFNKIKNKNDLKMCIWTFHNVVNKHTKHSEQPVSILDKYKRANLNLVLDRLFTVYKRSYISNKYLMYKFHSSKVLNNLKTYMISNKHKFKM